MRVVSGGRRYNPVDKNRSVGSDNARTGLPLRHFFRLIWPGLAIVFMIELAAIWFIDVTIEADAGEYVQISGNLAAKGIYSFDGETPTRLRQPVYPLFLYLVYWQLGQSYAVVRLLQALVGIVAFVLILRSYDYLLPRSGLRWASIIVGSYFPLWINCVFILTEMLTICGVALFVYWLVRSVCEVRLRPAVWCGLALGLCILTRPIALSLLLLVWLPFLLPARRRLLRLAVLIGTTVVVVMPWAVRNGAATGVFTPISAELTYHSLYTRVHNAEVPGDSLKSYPELAQRGGSDTQAVGALWRSFASDPLRFTINGVGRMLYAWSYFPGSRNYFDRPALRVLSHSIQGLMLLGIVVGLLLVDRRARVLLLYPALCFSSVLILTEAISRSLLPIMPPLLLALAFALRSCWGRLTDHPVQPDGQFT